MYANIQKFIQFQLTVNVAALVINVIAAISSGDVPLNAVQVGHTLNDSLSTQKSDFSKAFLVLVTLVCFLTLGPNCSST